MVSQCYIEQAINNTLMKKRRITKIRIRTSGGLRDVGDHDTDNHKIKSCFVIDSSKIQSQNMTSPVLTVLSTFNKS